MHALMYLIAVILVLGGLVGGFLTYTPLAPQLGVAVALSGMVSAALFLGIGFAISQLYDVKRALGLGEAQREPEARPVLKVTCPSCGEEQDAPADKPHYNCEKCGAPVIRDWVQLRREA